MLRNADVAMYRAKGSRSVAHRDLPGSTTNRTSSAACAPPTSCTGPSSATSSSSTTSPSSTSTPRPWSGWRLWCAGTTPPGAASPREFIALAEDSGLIAPLGAWVLNEACRQVAEWTTHADSDGDAARLNISVNVSALQLADPGFPDWSPRSRELGRSPRPAVARDHREHSHARPDEAVVIAPGTSRPRPALRDRRLRDRLLVAQLPAALPCRDTQDRPELRRRAGPRCRDAAIVRAIMGLGDPSAFP